MIWQQIEEWIKGVLTDGIIDNLSGMFDTVNQKGRNRREVGATPQGWNSGVFSMIQNLSETVIIPIAGRYSLSSCATSLFRW